MAAEAFVGGRVVVDPVAVDPADPAAAQGVAAAVAVEEDMAEEVVVVAVTAVVVAVTAAEAAAAAMAVAGMVVDAVTEVATVVHARVDDLRTLRYPECAVCIPVRALVRVPARISVCAPVGIPPVNSVVGLVPVSRDRTDKRVLCFEAMKIMSDPR